MPTTESTPVTPEPAPDLRPAWVNNARNCRRPNCLTCQLVDMEEAAR